ncbi:MAG: hypothetical protein KF843_04095 [Flavobacteriales bacterium]|nr:hypothetical protein [Flavobacteriales bacterium]
MKALLPVLIGAATVFLATGCKKDRDVPVPVVPVQIEINLNFPEYNALLVPGGWAYVTGGSEGLIVYRRSQDAFTALDRHCTYQAENICRVTVDDSQVMARDTTCCHSAFLLLDGSVSQGPAALGLKQYNTTFNGTILRIFN